MEILYSKRGLQLVLTGNYEDCTENTTIVTVELYSKWYNIYLVTFKKDIETIIDPLIDPILFPMNYATNGPDSVDHCPNPESVKKFADDKGYFIDELAYELIVGRWETEIKNNHIYNE